MLCGLYALCASPLPSSFCSQPCQGESLQPFIHGTHSAGVPGAVRLAKSLREVL